MKHLSLPRIIAGLLLVIFGLLVLHAPLTVWLTAQGAPVWVKAWKEVLLGVAAVMLMIDLIRRHKADILNDRLLWLIGGYVLLHCVVAFFSQSSPYSLGAGLLIDLRYVVFFATVYVFLHAYPQYRRRFIVVGIAGAGIVVGVALLQLVLPHDALKYLGYSDATIKPYILLDENPHFIRMNSTLRGPNPLGAYAMMVLLGVVAYGLAVGIKLTDGRKRALHLFLAIGGAVALWISYSRSAALGFAIGLITMVVLRYRNHPVRWRQYITTGLVIGMLALAGYSLRDTVFFKNIILHDNPTTGAAYTSDQGHSDSLKEGIAKMLQQPFGAGIGSTGSASIGSQSPLVIENQYLMVAHEVGWLGLAIFVWLWGLVLWRLWRVKQDWLATTVLASGVGLAAIACTWPVLVDDPVSMIWWGLAAVALTVQKESKGKKHGTTTHKKAA